MWQLVSCEIWRDGGSYSAVLTDGAKTVALWLQVSSWRRLEDRRYTGLFQSEGSDATLKSARLAAHEEARWCQALRQVLATAPSADTGADLLGEFVEILEKRLSPGGSP